MGLGGARGSMYWVPLGKESWGIHLSLLVDEDKDEPEGGPGFHACLPSHRSRLKLLTAPSPLPIRPTAPCMSPK